MITNKQFIFSGDRFAGHLAFWKKELSEPGPPWTFRGDKNGSGSRVVERFCFELEQACARRLEAIAGNRPMERFTLFLTAAAVVISKYSGYPRVALATPLTRAGVSDVQWETFVPVALDLDEKASLKKTIIDVSNRLKECYRFQNFPLDLAEEKVVRIADICISSEDLHVDIADDAQNWDFRIHVSGPISGAPCAFRIDADPRYYSPDFVRAFGRHLQVILNEYSDAEKTIGACTLLSEEEERRLIKDFNDTAFPYPEEKTVIDLFRENAARHPEHAALLYKDQTITYRELDARSDHLAAFLQSKGLAGRQIAAICLTRSVEMIVAVLGVLKSGNAYVPIDPKLPINRIRLILEDTGAGLLLADAQTDPALQETGIPERVVLDEQRPDVMAGETGNIPSPPTPDDPAYVIFTSGSTGLPKGVRITHRNLCLRLTGMANRLDFDRQTRTCLLTNFVFDVSLLEILLPLIAGGSLCIPPEETIYDLPRLADLMAAQKVTIIQATPSFLSELAQALDQEAVSRLGLTRICSGGESLKKELVEELKRKLPGVKLSNHYGPTETTIDAIALKDIDRYETNWIGKPLPNTWAYIVNAALKPVPVGVAGELLIGGAAVSPGYLNRPEINAEKFLSNPVDPQKGGPVYRSGDLARWLPDGNIEFIGRIDEQVKIRGFRVEPGEIETLLSGFSGVRNSAVTLFEDRNGSPQLAAYVVMKPGEPFDRQQLVAFLENQVPAYMVPARWVPMEHLPLTPTGKLDKKALPDPNEQEGNSAKYLAPKTGCEIGLAEIWADLLQREEISADDDFFEIGGHSLLAMRLITRIHRRFGVKVSFLEIFQNPELAGLAAVIDSKHPEQDQPIAFAVPRKGDNLFHLSDGQQQMWIMDQQQEDPVGFVLPDYFRLRGRLEIGHLEKAFHNIIRRHESLRTVFKVVDGTPYQLVRTFEQAGVRLLYEDFRAYNDREARAAAEAREDAVTSFDLENGPLIRAKLIQLSDVEFVFLMSIHHIVSDGVSTLNLFRELIAGYNALAAGKPYDPPALRIQYKDYAAWQQTRKIDPDHRDFWLKTFEGYSPSDLLIPDFPRTGAGNSKGEVEPFTISEDQTRALNRFCRKNGLSLFMLFRGIADLLLYRYSGQKDIAVGATVSDREHADLQDQIGLFVNILVFRSVIDPARTLKQHFDAIKQNTLESYKHQAFPFQELVKELQVPRRPGRNPLFDVYLAVGAETQTLLGSGKFAGLEMEKMDIGYAASIHDLIINVIEKESRIEGALIFPEGLYHKDRMSSLRDHLLHAIELLAGNENQVLDIPFSQIGFMPEAETNRMLAFGTRSAPFPEDKTVVHLFEEQAARYPEKAAIVFEDRELTYRELNEASNRLAGNLIQNGAGSGSLVAVCLDRSAEMIVSIMGILKAGAAYLPIDPGYPGERISFMLADSAYSSLIDQTFLREHNKIKDRFSELNPVTKPGPEDLYSVIYTSGSTGRPKGVMLEHRGLVNHIHNVKNHYQIDRNSRFLQFFNIGFDAAAEEIFTALSFGATLCIRNEDDLDAKNMIRFLNKHAVTHADFSTAYFEGLISAIPNGALRQPLVSCGIGGEKAGKAFIVKNRSTLRSFTARLFNVYGPTETTLTVSIHDVLNDADLEERVNVPIGIPYPNRSIYVLDEALRPAPIGVYGEIHIGGTGIARGYLNRPELTAEKFVRDPFATNSGARMYRTGDLGRWLPDGNLEFLGRTDSQVKIRGYRIEPGEIESVLQRSPLIREGVVVARDEPGASKRLVAYVVPVQPRYNRKDLLAHLRSALPDYMIPSFVVELAEMPLTRNGKLDKKALPAPEIASLGSADYEAPGNEIENLLARIWADLLGLERVGINDNFYELGGDSIKALQVASQLHRAGWKVETKDIFLHQTIGELGTRLQAISRIPDQAPVVGRVPLNAIQKAFFGWGLHQPNHFNQAILLDCPADITADGLTGMLERIQEHHDLLRARFAVEENGREVLICDPPGGQVPIEVINPGNAPDPISEMDLICDRVQRQIDITGAIWKAVLIDQQPSKKLLIVAHHLIIDAVSWRILLEDLAALYRQWKKNMPLDLFLKTDSFHAWATGMQAYARGEACQTSKHYWRSIAGKEMPALPRDNDHPDNRYGDEYNKSCKLTADLTKKLIHRSSRVSGAEMPAILLAALAKALQEVFGLQRVAVMLEGHGREEILRDLNVSRTVGWFTSMYPVILECQSGEPVSRTLGRVSETLGKIPNKGIDYGILRYLTPESLKEDMDFRLQPRISFNYLGQAERQSRDGDFKIAAGSVGRAIGEANQREYDLEVGAVVMDEELVIELTFNALHFYPQTIQTLLARFKDELETLAENKSAGQDEGPQARTFTGKDLSRENLEKLKQLFE